MSVAVAADAARQKLRNCYQGKQPDHLNRLSLLFVWPHLPLNWVDSTLYYIDDPLSIPEMELKL